MRRPARALFAGAIVAGLALSGCGSTTPTETVTVTTAAPATAPSSEAPSDAVATTAAATSHHATRHRAAHAIPAGRTACDAHITVKSSTTSCAFGENVFYGYWTAQDQGDDAFTAYSPVSKQSYPMTCAIGTTIVCRAGDGGEVRFAQASIDAYDATQAARYATTHDTGPSDAGSAAPSEGSGSAASASGSDCDPSYEGACLDPNASDYDCEGGSGNGPEYTGTVTVVGDDHFGLDADGDGVGCE